MLGTVLDCGDTGMDKINKNPHLLRPYLPLKGPDNKYVSGVKESFPEEAIFELSLHHISGPIK